MADPVAVVLSPGSRALDLDLLIDTDKRNKLREKSLFSLLFVFFYCLSFVFVWTGPSPTVDIFVDTHTHTLWFHSLLACL